MQQQQQQRRSIIASVPVPFHCLSVYLLVSLSLPFSNSFSLPHSLSHAKSLLFFFSLLLLLASLFVSCLSLSNLSIVLSLLLAVPIAARLRVIMHLQLHALAAVAAVAA